MTTCYSCKKEIGVFKPRGMIKDILRAGYKAPDGMTQYDKLCQECLDGIKINQIQGKKTVERVNVIGQLVLCFIFPLLAFWRIEKTIKFLKYYFIIASITATIIIVPMYLFPNNENTGMLFGIGLMLLYIALWILPMVWVYYWTKDYNKNSI